VRKEKAPAKNSGNGILSEEQLETLAGKLAEREVEARERLQVMRDLFPREDHELLMMSRTPSNMIMPLARYITWIEAANANRREPLAKIYLRSLQKLLIGKEGLSRYEVLHAYTSQKQQQAAEEEGEL